MWVDKVTIIWSSKLYKYLDFTPFLKNISDFCLRQYSTLRQKECYCDSKSQTRGLSETDHQVSSGKNTEQFSKEFLS